VPERQARRVVAHGRVVLDDGRIRLLVRRDANSPGSKRDRRGATFQFLRLRATLTQMTSDMYANLSRAA